MTRRTGSIQTTAVQRLWSWIYWGKCTFFLQLEHSSDLQQLQHQWLRAISDEPRPQLRSGQTRLQEYGVSSSLRERLCGKRRAVWLRRCGGKSTCETDFTLLHDSLMENIFSFSLLSHNMQMQWRFSKPRLSMKDVFCVLLRFGIYNVFRSLHSFPTFFGTGVVTQRWSATGRDLSVLMFTLCLCSASASSSSFQTLWHNNSVVWSWLFIVTKIFCPEAKHEERCPTHIS